MIDREFIEQVLRTGTYLNKIQVIIDDNNKLRKANNDVKEANASMIKIATEFAKILHNVVMENKIKLKPEYIDRIKELNHYMAEAVAKSCGISREELEESLNEK